MKRYKKYYFVSYSTPRGFGRTLLITDRETLVLEEVEAIIGSAVEHPGACILFYKELSLKEFKGMGDTINALKA